MDNPLPDEAAAEELNGDLNCDAALRVRTLVLAGVTDGAAWA
jgi:hypothetical protein